MNLLQTGCEGFKHVEKFYANFFAKIFRKTVAGLVQRLRDVAHSSEIGAKETKWLTNDFTK